MTESKEKKFGIEDYNRIHDLVYKYQNGSEDAAEEIIESFGGILSNYLALIKYGQFNVNDFSLRSFVKLFIKNENDKKKMNIYYYLNFSPIVINKCTQIIHNLFTSLEVEDAKNELIIVLLTMCSKYKDSKPSFHNYIKKNFHYYAYRHFEKLTRDPLSNGYAICNSMSFATSEDEYNLDTISNMADKSAKLDEEMLLNEIDLHYKLLTNSDVVIKTKKGVTKYDDAFFDINWINGITCSDTFKILNPFERHILVLWYVHKKTDSYIADLLGVCRGTINKKRAIAKNKIKESMQNNGLLKSSN